MAICWFANMLTWFHDVIVQFSAETCFRCKKEHAWLKIFGAKTWNGQILKFWNQPWNLRTLKLCNLHWKSATLEFLQPWMPGTLEPWSSRTLEFWGPCWKSPCSHGILESWNLEAAKPPRQLAALAGNSLLLLGCKAGLMFLWFGVAIDPDLSRSWCRSMLVLVSQLIHFWRRKWSPCRWIAQTSGRVTNR